MVYINDRSCGYGCGCRTYFTEGSGTVMNVLHNLQEIRVLWHYRAELAEVPYSYENVVPVPQVLGHGRTELTEDPGMGMRVAQNAHKFSLGYYPVKSPGVGLYVLYRNALAYVADQYRASAVGLQDGRHRLTQTCCGAHWRQ